MLEDDYEIYNVNDGSIKTIVDMNKPEFWSTAESLHIPYGKSLELGEVGGDNETVIGGGFFEMTANGNKVMDINHTGLKLQQNLTVVGNSTLENVSIIDITNCESIKCNDIQSDMINTSGLDVENDVVIHGNCNMVEVITNEITVNGSTTLHDHVDLATSTIDVSGSTFNGVCTFAEEIVFINGMIFEDIPVFSNGMLNKDLYEAGISKASQMKGANFWDSNLFIPAEQGMSIGSISMYPHKNGDSQDGITIAGNLSLSGSLNVARDITCNDRVTINYSGGWTATKSKCYISSGEDAKIYAWTNGQPRFEINLQNGQLVRASYTTGITKCSQMIGDFWDSDLNINKNDKKIIVGTNPCVKIDYATFSTYDSSGNSQSILAKEQLILARTSTWDMFNKKFLSSVIP